MNFKLDPKHSFYRRRRHSSQRAVTVQRVDNAQLEKLSPFSHTSMSDKSQEGASSSPCSKLAEGQEVSPASHRMDLVLLWGQRGLKPSHGARTAPRKISQGLKTLKGTPELNRGFYPCMDRGVFIIYRLVSILM